jgi:hypothetical protein
MADNSIVCKSRAAAFAGLETIADSMPRGIQRDTLIAIRDWIVENMPPSFDEKMIEKIQKIFEGSEWQQKGRAWLDREMENPAYGGSTEGHLHHKHHEMIREPEDGAELDCFWNAKYKAWEPIGYCWPDVQHKTDGVSGEEE